MLERLPALQQKRTHLLQISEKLKEALTTKGYNCPSVSHIVPMIVGASENTILKAEELQRKGFYALPVRPPTVPEGTSRIRFSLTADITEHEIDQLIKTDKTDETVFYHKRIIKSIYCFSSQAGEWMKLHSCKFTRPIRTG